MTQSLPPKNHNNPPSELEMLKEELALRHVTIMREAEDHSTFVKQIPAVLPGEADASFVSDFIKKVDKCAKDMEAQRKSEKAPFFSKGKFVDEFFNDYIDKLEAVKARANIPLHAFLERKANEERLLREAEATALRAEADRAREQLVVATNAEIPQAIELVTTMHNVAQVAEQRAVAPTVTLGKTQGAYSAAGLKEEWVGTLVDVETLDLGKLRMFISQSELQDAIKRFVKAGGRQLDGAKIEKITVTKVK